MIVEYLVLRSNRRKHENVEIPQSHLTLQNVRVFTFSAFGKKPTHNTTPKLTKPISPPTVTFPTKPRYIVKSTKHETDIPAA